MKIGYCRVSTEEQNPDLQLAALKAAGCEKILQNLKRTKRCRRKIFEFHEFGGN